MRDILETESDPRNQIQEQQEEAIVRQEKKKRVWRRRIPKIRFAHRVRLAMFIYLKVGKAIEETFLVWLFPFFFCLCLARFWSQNPNFKLSFYSITAAVLLFFLFFFFSIYFYFYILCDSIIQTKKELWSVMFYQTRPLISRA